MKADICSHNVPCGKALFRIGRTLTAPAAFSLAEKVLIDPFYLDCAADPHPNIMFNHKVSQTRPVDQDDPLGDLLSVLTRTSAERRGSDKNTLRCTKAYKATDEALHLRPLD